MTQPALNSSLVQLLKCRIEGDEFTLPVLPAVATEVLATVNSDDCDARCLAEIVQRDPALAAGVLRIVNSAQYAPNEPIVSLIQAIGRMGLSALRDMVMAIAVEGAVFYVEGHDAYVTAAWRHAHLTGQLAQEIARIRRSNVEAAFLAGLLHDVGIPVVLQGLIDLGESEGHAVDMPLIEAAVDALHADLGARLIDEWGLPEWTRAAALYHHAPEEAPEHGELVSTVALADALSYWILDGDCEGMPPGLEHAEALDLYADDLEELKERAVELLTP
ncbi:MAG: HDOD domain-containing protein [Planctomycetota bacterium]